MHIGCIQVVTSVVTAIGMWMLPTAISPGSDTEMSDSVIPYPTRGCTPYIIGPMGQPGVYEYVIISGENLNNYSYGKILLSEYSI